MQIFALTLNPAFDMHCNAPDFHEYHENLVTVTDYNAGGKGINVSRALNANGADNINIAIVGRENGDTFLKMVKEDGVCCQAVMVPGRIRENITLHTEGAPETRVSFKGFEVSGHILSEVETLLSSADSETFVTLTGSNPKGISLDDTKKMAQRLIQKGAKVVIDSNAFSTEDLMEVKPWLIKPNEEEILKYTGLSEVTLDDIRDWAEKMHEAGIENVVVSLGGKGAFLYSSEGAFLAKGPKITPLSTIGAGDSFIAGFVAASSRGESSSEALKNAVATGTSACLTPGTCPPRAEDIQRIRDQVVTEILC